LNTDCITPSCRSRRTAAGSRHEPGAPARRLALAYDGRRHLCQHRLRARDIGRVGRQHRAAAGAGRLDGRAGGDRARLADRREQPLLPFTCRSSKGVAGARGVVVIARVDRIGQELRDQRRLAFDVDGSRICGQMRPATRLGDREVEPAEAVDQLEIERRPARPDAALTDLVDARQRQVASPLELVNYCYF